MNKKEKIRTVGHLLPIAALLLLAGCGQKGDLYLPEESRKDASPVTPATNTTTTTPGNETLR